MTAGGLAEDDSQISRGSVTKASLSSGKAAWIGLGKFPEEKRLHLNPLAHTPRKGEKITLAVKVAERKQGDP